MGYEIDFLAVGEDKSGDAITLRFGNLVGDRKEQTVVVIDGGFADTGKQVVDHLRTHYRTTKVELVVSTHPDGDHSAGLETVLTECDVDAFWMHQPWNHTDDVAKMFEDGRVTDSSVSEELRKSLDSARNLERAAQRRGIPVVEPFTGLADVSQSVWVVGPTKAYYESLLPEFRCTPEPVQKTSVFQAVWLGTEEAIKVLAEHWNIETLDDKGVTSAENNSSVILLVTIGERWLFFTADAGIPALTAATNTLVASNLDLAKIQFIQVPHHGSRRNVSPAILDLLLGPKLQAETTSRTAYVSVAKPNDPKHPSKKVTNAFRRRGVPVHATAGRSICHFFDTPTRQGWISVSPLPFYNEVEE